LYNTVGDGFPLKLSQQMKPGFTILNMNPNGNQWNGNTQLPQGRRRNSSVCNHQEKSWLQSFGVERFCSCEILA
jgi:hypothetical protein